MPEADRTAGRLAHHREDLGQVVPEDGVDLLLPLLFLEPLVEDRDPLGDLLPELGRPAGKILRRELLDLRFQLVDAVHIRVQPLEPALARSAENLIKNLFDSHLRKPYSHSTILLDCHP